MVQVPVLGRTARCIALCAGLLLAALALTLSLAPAAHAQAVTNPPPCNVNAWEFPCTPAGMYEQFHGGASYSIPLSAATQTASGVAGDPGGSGTSNISMDFTDNRLCATTSWSGIDSPVVMAHIHGGAYGQPENPAVTISLFKPDMLNGRSSPASGCETVPSELMWAIRQCPSQFNVVVHSQKHPVGAIRGQFPAGCSTKP